LGEIGSSELSKKKATGHLILGREKHLFIYASGLGRSSILQSLGEAKITVPGGT